MRSKKAGGHGGGGEVGWERNQSAELLVKVTQNVYKDFWLKLLHILYILWCTLGFSFTEISLKSKKEKEGS